MQFSAREIPDQPAVDGAEGELAGIGQRARAWHVVEDPADLGGGKIRIDQQTGFGANGILVAGGFERIAKRRGAAVLPDDSVIQGAAAIAIPDDGGFTLVGDTDGGNRGAVETGLGDSFRRYPGLRRPDLLRIMLNPAGLRINLLEFLLRRADDVTGMIEQDSA